MLTQARQLQPPQTPGKAVAVARPRPAGFEPVLLLTLFVLAALIWLLIGGAVMRGTPAPGPRIDRSL